MTVDAYPVATLPKPHPTPVPSHGWSTSTVHTSR